MESNPAAKNQGTSGLRRISRRRAAGTILAVAGVALGATAAAQVFEPREFLDPENERRYQNLIAELRCLVCQNQNLADSNAPLASDLRTIVYEMIQSGNSDAEIVEFMVDRYGKFVLYRPPFDTATALLWLGPFLLCAGGLWLLFRKIAKRRALQSTSAALNAAERERLEDLLGERNTSDK